MLLRNCWKLEGSNNYNNDKKAWANKDEQPQDNLQDAYANKFSKEVPQNKGKFRNKKKEELDEKPSTKRTRTEDKKEECKPLKKLKNVLIRRGGKGIIGLARQFKIFDDNNSKTLDMDEFTKAIQDFQVGLSPEEAQELFQMMDQNNSGLIDYEEFLRKLRGNMNAKRKEIVLKAFDKLDIDGSGIVEINDIKNIYTAKNQKEVLEGKKSEEEVLGEFLENFEMHHNILKGVRDRRVTKDEFIDYYEDISMSIEDDGILYYNI